MWPLIPPGNIHLEPIKPELHCQKYIYFCFSMLGVEADILCIYYVKIGLNVILWETGSIIS